MGRKGARAEGALAAACSVLGSRGAGVGLVGGAVLAAASGRLWGERAEQQDMRARQFQ